MGVACMCHLFTQAQTHRIATGPTGAAARLLMRFRVGQPGIRVSLAARCFPLPESHGQSYPSLPASVPLARRALTAFAAAAGASPAQLEAVRWAASEALTNVVMHAYPGVEGELHVAAAVTGGELWVSIADDGCGLDAASRTPGLGLGLVVMAQNCDDLVIGKRASGGTEVQMRFKLAVADPPTDGQDRGSVACARRPGSSRFSTTT
jgi:stage II sporulation protein AB (anti-sigma F factor)